MKSTLGFVASLAIVFWFCSTCDVSAQLATPVASAESDKAQADVAAHLNRLRSWQEFRSEALDPAGVPFNDVVFFATKTRQEAIDAYKRHLRSTTGRAIPAQVQAFAESIDHPGVKLELVVSPESKALSAAVSEDAPLGAYFKPLLAGDHATAAKAAWKIAHTPGKEAEYNDWLQAVAKAVQCHDQAYGGRADDFLKWSSCSLKDAAGQIVAANPIADVVGPRPIPAEMLAKVNPDALAYLNKLTDIRQFSSKLTQLQPPPQSNPQPQSPRKRKRSSPHVTSSPSPPVKPPQLPLRQFQVRESWFPENDVIILCLHNDPNAYAVPAYAWYLRRIAGRADPAKVKAVYDQLLKGGDARPLSVSEVSRTLSGSLAENAPLKDYLQPLLAGDYETAARVAWGHAHEATNQDAYDMWLEAVAIAIRCHDQQCSGGRADAFALQVRNALTDEHSQKIAANSVADLVGNQAPVGEGGPAKPPVDVIAQLNGTKSPQDLKISLWAPATDVIALTTLEPGQILDRFKWHQRQATGRIDNGSLTELEKQLKEGGNARLLVVSPVSKALSAAIQEDAPLADYFKPLLAGDHRKAVQVAWKKMLNSRTDEQYSQWLAAVVAAVRCHDQSIKRADDFKKWSVSDLKDAEGKPVEANPITDLLTDAPTVKAAKEE